MEQHSSLVEQLNSAQSHHDGDDVERNILYRQLASLEPVVSLANQLKSKEKVCEDVGHTVVIQLTCTITTAGGDGAGAADSAK